MSEDKVHIKELEKIVWEDEKGDTKFTITADELLVIYQQANDYPSMVDGYNYDTREANEPFDNICKVIKSVMERAK